MPGNWEATFAARLQELFGELQGCCGQEWLAGNKLYPNGLGSKKESSSKMVLSHLRYLEVCPSWYFSIPFSRDFHLLRFKVERIFPAKSALVHSAQWCAEPNTGNKLCCNKWRVWSQIKCVTFKVLSSPPSERQSVTSGPSLMTQSWMENNINNNKRNKEGAGAFFK